LTGYPITLVHLHHTRCVVVGGGTVAARKVDGLRAADARVVVISPVLCEPLEELAAQGEIEAVRRAYRVGDLEGALLVIAATDDPGVNQRVWEEAQARDILVNVVDDPNRCTFFLPAVVRRGPLTLAVSTDGWCPALARHLRQRLEREFGPAYGPFVEWLGELRQRVVSILPPARRKAFWDRLFRSDVLTLLDAGDETAARRRAEEVLQQIQSQET